MFRQILKAICIIGLLAFVIKAELAKEPLSERSQKRVEYLHDVDFTNGLDHRYSSEQDQAPFGKLNQSTTHPYESSAKKLTLICVLTLLTLLIILSTKYDSRTRDEKCDRNPLLLSFSIHSNASKLFIVSNNKSLPEIKCLHGIRVLSTISIVLLHAYFYRVKSFQDDPDYIEWKKTKWASTVAALSVSVDTFLVISGAMTTRSMLRELDLGNYNFFRTSFQRYIRLTPSFIAIILVNNNLGHFLSANAKPSFLNYSVIPCEKNWWYALFHLQVYTNPQEMCVHTSWYLSVDWQMSAFVAPVLVYLLWKFGQQVLKVVGAIIFASCLYGVKIAYEYKFVAQDLGVGSSIYGPYYHQFYYPTHLRGAPYLVGIFLGYYLYYRDHNIDGSKRFQKSVIAYAILAAPFTITNLYDVLGENSLFNSIFLSFVRVFWGVAVAWVIYNFNSGNSSVFNRFLSAKLWIPIGKLGFSIYLVSSVTQHNVTSSKDRQLNLETTYMIGEFIKDLLISVVGAIILYFMVEEPFSAIGRHFSKNWGVKTKTVEKIL